MAENNRILIVDDEEGIVEAYVDILSPAPVSIAKKSSRGPVPSAAKAKPGPPYQLLTAKSGEEAVEIVRREFQAGRRVACGFFDVKMGAGLDGLQTIQEIWKIDPDLGCTVVTAYHDRSVDDIDKLFGDRFKDQWDYLNKPFTQAEIVQKARQMVAAWNRKRALEDAITTLKETQQQLVQSERLATIGQLARAVGHEFGNLLQTIMGQAEVAISQEDPERVRAKLQMIVRAAERASLITRNLLSMSKPSAQRAQVDLAAVVRETLLLVSPKLAKASLTLVDRCEERLVPIVANSAELEQVLLNLIINAMHATAPGGAIEVGCRNDGRGVLVWVKDSGSGIAPHVLPKIFDYGFTTKGERGSGIGLPISKSIVDAHGGWIDVQTQEGNGTTFSVRLPGKPS